MKDVREDYFDTEKCKRAMNPYNIDKPEWFSMVEDVATYCSQKKAKDLGACEQFKKHFNILIDISRRILYHNNDVVKSCNASKSMGKLLRNGPC